MNQVFVTTRQVQAFFLLAIMLLLQSCAVTDAMAKAETIEQRAFAAYGTFVIIEEQAAKLVSSGQIPNSAVRAIGRADAQVKPVADSMLDAALEFTVIRVEFEAGGTGEEKFVRTMNELNGWVERAMPLIANLITAVRGAET
ncbi:MAG: hypothetical protein KAJ19_28780 [Gammaproteobacteria bacterium]|nr:hypothetical protein [Gammaproteobacteria bacterium]